MFNKKFFVFLFLLICSVPLFAAGYIKVTVSNVSDAWVTVDGAYVGKQPVLVQVSSGYHTVIVEQVGYVTYSERVYVKDGSTKYVSVYLQKDEGSIYATANISSAKVYLDGLYKGTTPLHIYNVKSGLHNLVFKQDSYDDVLQTVYVTAGTETQANAKFIGATLLAYSNINGTSVYIDNESKGTTPATIDDVPPGYHDVMLYKKHYTSYSQRIYFTAGRTQTISGSIEKISGKVQISTTPANAYIEVSGKPSTYLGDNIFEVDAGECTITISAFGYETKKITSKVALNKTTQESVSLKEAAFALTHLTADTDSINPKNTNLQNLLTIEWGATAPETGILTVTDPSGKIVSSQFIAFTNWTGTITWDGKLDGKIVPQGTYNITLECQDYSKTVSVLIDYGIKDYVQHSRGGNDFSGVIIPFICGAVSSNYKVVNWGFNFLMGEENIYGGVNVSGSVGKYSNIPEDTQVAFVDITAIIGASYNINKFRPFVQGELGYYKNPVQNRSGFIWGLETGVDYADPIKDKYIVSASYVFKHYKYDGASHGLRLGVGFALDECCWF